MLFYKGQVLSEEIWGAWRHPVYPNTTYSKLFKFLSISGQGVIQEFAVGVVKHELGIFNNRAEVSMYAESFPYTASKCSENN